MIQNESVVNVVDNTWAKLAKVIRVLKWSNGRFATIWDIVVVAILDAAKGWQYDKGDVAWGVVVRTRKENRRPDGTYVRFEDNAIAIIDKEKNPKWKRIFWPVAKELRTKGFRNIANLAEEII